jgi:hypothetical protein
MARIGSSGNGGSSGGSSTGNIDGGSADAIYLVSQVLDGGSASG